MSAKKTKRKVRTGDVLVSKIPLRLTAPQRQLVDRLRQESARLWNNPNDSRCKEQTQQDVTRVR